MHINDYPFSTWLIDLCEIMEKREFIDKKTALLILVEDIEEFKEMWDEGVRPMEAYHEYAE